MISFTVHTTKGKMRLSSPSSWEEVSLGQLVAIEKSSKDVVEVFSILSGVDFEIIEESTDDKLLDQLYAVTHFIFTAPDWDKLPIPKTLLIGEKIITPPEDIGNETLGQKILFDQALMDSKKTVEIIPMILAIYLQPVISGEKFDRLKIPETLELLNQQPAILMYPLAGFFLNKPKNLQRFGMIGLHLLKTWKNPRLKNLQESSDLESSIT